jgi:hypothetical protein
MVEKHFSALKYLSQGTHQRPKLSRPENRVAMYLAATIPADPAPMMAMREQGKI